MFTQCKMRSIRSRCFVIITRLYHKWPGSWSFALLLCLFITVDFLFFFCYSFNNNFFFSFYVQTVIILHTADIASWPGDHRRSPRPPWPPNEAAAPQIDTVFSCNNKIITTETVMYSFCSLRDRSVSFTERLVARVRCNNRARARGALQCRPFVRPSVIRSPKVYSFVLALTPPLENPTDFIILRVFTCRSCSSFFGRFCVCVFPTGPVSTFQCENDFVCKTDERLTR